MPETFLVSVVIPTFNISKKPTLPDSYRPDWPHHIETKIHYNVDKKKSSLAVSLPIRETSLCSKSGIL